LNVIDLLHKAQTALQDNKDLDPFIKEKAEILTDNYYIIEDLAMELSQYTDTLEFDAERLNEIESRLNEINRLKKKYGTSVNDMLEYLEHIDDEINTISNKDSNLASLEKEISELEKDALLEAKQLHDVREKAAGQLKIALEEELKDLYLDKASFEVMFLKSTEKDGDIKLHKNGL